MRQDNLILSSAVEGQILDHDKPVAGLKVRRTISWNMEEGSRAEITSTDQKGQFKFSEVRGAAEFGFLAKLFHVPAIAIDIDLLEGDLKTSLFSIGRSSYEPAVETGFESIQLSCDLKNRELYRGLLPTITCDVKRTKEMENRFE